MHGYYILNPFACRYVSDYRCLVSSSLLRVWAPLWTTRFYYETETSFLSPSLLDYKSREWHESVKAGRKAFQRMISSTLKYGCMEQKTFEDKCRNSRRCHGGNKTGRSKIKYHSGLKWPKMSYHYSLIFQKVVFRLEWIFLLEWIFTKWNDFFLKIFSHCVTFGNSKKICTKF